MRLEPGRRLRIFAALGSRRFSKLVPTTERGKGTQMICLFEDGKVVNSPIKSILVESEPSFSKELDARIYHASIIKSIPVL